MPSSSATARVQVTVEIVAGTWGNDCSLEQVYKQAGEDACNKLTRALNPKDSAPIGRIVGTPKVLAVLVEAPHGG